MNPNHLVISRPLAERLQGLGVKKESVFWWHAYSPSYDKTITQWKLVYFREHEEDIPAYTSGELGEIFIENNLGGSLEFCSWRWDSWCWKETKKQKYHPVLNEAEARGMQLAYLREQGLITI